MPASAVQPALPTNIAVTASETGAPGGEAKTGGATPEEDTRLSSLPGASSRGPSRSRAREPVHMGVQAGSASVSAPAVADAELVPIRVAKLRVVEGPPQDSIYFRAHPLPACEPVWSPAELELMNIAERSSTLRHRQSVPSGGSTGDMQNIAAEIRTGNWKLHEAATQTVEVPPVLAEGSTGPSCQNQVVAAGMCINRGVVQILVLQAIEQVIWEAPTQAVGDDGLPAAHGLTWSAGGSSGQHSSYQAWKVTARSSACSSRGGSSGSADVQLGVGSFQNIREDAARTVPELVEVARGFTGPTNLSFRVVDADVADRDPGLDTEKKRRVKLTARSSAYSATVTDKHSHPLVHELQSPAGGQQK